MLPVSDHILALAAGVLSTLDPSVFTVFVPQVLFSMAIVFARPRSVSAGLWPSPAYLTGFGVMFVALSRISWEPAQLVLAAPMFVGFLHAAVLAAAGVWLAGVRFPRRRQAPADPAVTEQGRDAVLLAVLLGALTAMVYEPPLGEILAGIQLLSGFADGNALGLLLMGLYTTGMILPLLSAGLALGLACQLLTQREELAVRLHRASGLGLTLWAVLHWWYA